jgi:hypothetical protein
MRLASITSLSALAVGLLAVSAGAATVNLPVFSTGNNGSTLITAGNLDTTYTLTSAPAGVTTGVSPIVTNDHPSPWVPNSPTFSESASKWVSPGPSIDGQHNYPAGTYDYTTTFTLTSADELNTGEIILSATGDNTIHVFFNGTLIGGNNSSTSYSAFSGPFTITSGFQDGINTLLFVVTNAAGNPTPSGLDVSISQATIDTVPEPSAVAAFSIAGIMLGGLLLRGRRMAAPKAAI